MSVEDLLKSAVKVSDGQKADGKKVATAYQAVQHGEAISGFERLFSAFEVEIAAHAYSRWEGYFAASLLAYNARQSSKATEAAFDRVAVLAQDHFNALQRQAVLVPNFEVKPTEAELARGARFGEALLNALTKMVQETGIDREQSYFAIALLTITLRTDAPANCGGATLFDAAATAAWNYYNNAP